MKVEDNDLKTYSTKGRLEKFFRKVKKDFGVCYFLKTKLQ